MKQFWRQFTRYALCLNVLYEKKLQWFKLLLVYGPKPTWDHMVLRLSTFHNQYVFIVQDFRVFMFGVEY